MVRRISNACIQWIPYKLHAIFFDKYGWPNCMYTFPWLTQSRTYKARLCYTHSCMHIPSTILTYLKLGSWTMVWSSSPWLKHRDVSLLRLRVCLGLRLGALYWRPLPHASLATGMRYSVMLMPWCTCITQWHNKFMKLKTLTYIDLIFISGTQSKSYQ